MDELYYEKGLRSIRSGIDGKEPTGVGLQNWEKQCIKKSA